MCRRLMDAVSWEGDTAAVLHSPVPPPRSPGGIADAERSWRDGEERLRRYRCPRRWHRAGMCLGGGRAGGRWVLPETDAARMNVLLRRAAMEKPGSALSPSPRDRGREG